MALTQPKNRFTAPTAALAVGLLVGGYLLPRLAAIAPGSATTGERTVVARGPLAATETAAISLFREAAPSVVFITQRQQRVNMFSGRTIDQTAGQGSGFVWDDQGHIVTNSHVILNADSIVVTLHDHRSYDAKFVGWAPMYDLAVLRIEAPEGALRPVPLGTSHDLQVGQNVFAIGNPFGLDQTLTTGIVSAIGRKIQSLSGRDIDDVIQTDAAINPGNSGGPLLDSAGRLIGINTAIYTASGGSAGIGFAVPADTIARIVPDLIAHGQIVRPVLGIEVFDDQRNALLLRRLGIQGLMIRTVAPELGAARAGLRGVEYDRQGRLRQGDIILAVDSEPVLRLDDLHRVLESKRSGERVKVKYLRGEREDEVEVELGMAGE
jgi:S1-C subfamily serine protease